MASRLKKLFFKSKSTTDENPLTKLEALLTRNRRLYSSQSFSRKQRKENECIREKRGLESERSNTNNRRLQMRFPLPQKRYPTELCSPCDQPDKDFCLEQQVPLLSGKTMNLLDTSSASLSHSTSAGSLHRSSCESVSDSLQYCEEVPIGQPEISPVSIDLPFDEQEHTENNPGEQYTGSPTVPNLASTQQNKRLESSANLMQVLSHHEIEWTAMLELQRVDTTGFFSGLTSREIRWIVRESRCRTWLVGSLGPLMEERSEATDVMSFTDIDTDISEEESTECKF